MVSSFSSRGRRAAILSLLSAFPVFAQASTVVTSSTTAAAYTLQTTYAGSSFFDGFTFFTDADPTHGFVTYVDRSTAQNSGLISAADGSPIYIGVDHTHTYDSSAYYYNTNGVGRPSVRITSNQKYNHGLFIADIANMPGGVCGTWPALWTLGDGTWPYHGEIDIIEQVNSASTDQSSLHTGGTCMAPSGVTQTGTTLATNCTYDSNTGANSAGCEVADPDTYSFGLNFNSNDGGVYAMEWTSSAIKIWFWRRGSIPSDITIGTPSPSGWGTPNAFFQGACNIDSNFINHQIVLDTTFCGDWAGNVWSDSCAASTGVSSCAQYVANNPGAFKNMYWSINSIKVYQQGSGGSSSAVGTSSTSSAHSTTTTTTTSSLSSYTSSHPTTSSTSSPHPTTSSTSTHSTVSSSTSTHPTTSSTHHPLTSSSHPPSPPPPSTTLSSKHSTTSSSSSKSSTTTTKKTSSSSHTTLHTSTSTSTRRTTPTPTSTTRR